MPEQLVTTVGTFEYENLFAGGVQPVVTDSVTLKSGQSYVRGTVLGITNGGEATIVDSTKSDGSEVPYAILAGDYDATDESVPAAVYLSGEFNETVLTFGGTDTFATHKSALRKIGIFLKDVVKA